MLVDVGISVGELVDKVSILRVKMAKIVGDPIAVEACGDEYRFLEPRIPVLGPNDKTIQEELYETNTQLWEIEDEIRLCHIQAAKFPLSISRLARVVMLSATIIELNQIRSEYKKMLNKSFGSPTEIKKYQGT